MQTQALLKPARPVWAKAAQCSCSYRHSLPWRQQCLFRGNSVRGIWQRTSLRHRAQLRQMVVLAFETADEVEESVMSRMEKCVSSLKRTFTTIRTGRASPDMLDRIEVDYYGAPTQLRQLAGVSVPDSSSLVIQPYDKGSMQAIEKAIQMSDLGLPPNNDGKVIRLNIPQLTAERRKEFAKQAGKMAEDGKVAIRNVRRDAMKAVAQLKSDGMGEDEVKALEESVQEYTDDAVKEVESLLKKKQEELTTV